MSSNRPGRARAATLVALALLLAACSGGDSVQRPPAVARVAVSGASDSLTVGDRRRLLAAPADANGTPLAGRHVTWTSSDASIATVDTAGVVTALAPGRTTVTAESEGVRGDAIVAVRRRPVTNVTVDRVADTLWLGRTHTLRAQTGAADGTLLTDRTVTWLSSDTTLLTIAATADGGVVARGVAVGTTRLVVRSEGVESSIPVVVVPVPIGLLDLTAPDTVLVGRTATLRARAWAPDGVALGSADLAGRVVTWSSDRTTQLDVTGVADDVAHSTSGLSATARAMSAGNATVTASIDGRQARYTIITARPRVARLTFSAVGLALTVGQATTVAATPFDAEGLPIAEVPIAYALASGGDAVRLTQTTTADGAPAVRLEALAPGSATLSVLADGQTATLPISVAVDAASLHVYPTSINAAPDARGRLTVSLVDGAGTAFPTGAITYRTTNPAIVNVDELGRLTTGSVGSASLLVSASGATVTVPVTVSMPPASAFQIQVRPIGTVAPEVLAAAQRAADRWTRVVIGALPPAQVDLAPGECDAGTPMVHEAVTGLIVFVRSEPVDGARGVLAYAGPCAVRETAIGGLPLVGEMTIDTDDIPLLTGSTGALAEDVLTHEMGHVLGIGTLWYGGTPAGSLMRSTAGADPRFVGSAASAATAQIGLAASGLDGAPVEDTGGPGTAGAHWRERTFSGELMTGWINAAPNPLSLVTVLSLRDLGYRVTETGADIVSPVSIAGGAAFAVSLPSTNRIPSTSRGTTSTGPIALGERLLRPKYVAGPHGTRKATAERQ